MQAPVVPKFAFRIRTRVGRVVDNLMIPGPDEVEARRRLHQIYHGCEILDCVCHRGAVRTPVANFEEVVNLITR